MDNWISTAYVTTTIPVSQHRGDRPQRGRYNWQEKLDLTGPETSEFSLSGKHLDPSSRDAQPCLPACFRSWLSNHCAFQLNEQGGHLHSPTALTHVSREQRLFLECFWGQFYKWKAYPQMPLVTRNTLPTDPQCVGSPGSLTPVARFPSPLLVYHCAQRPWSPQTRRVGTPAVGWCDSATVWFSV